MTTPRDKLHNLTGRVPPRSLTTGTGLAQTPLPEVGPAPSQHGGGITGDRAQPGTDGAQPGAAIENLDPGNTHLPENQEHHLGQLSGTIDGDARLRVDGVRA